MSLHKLENNTMRNFAVLALVAGSIAAITPFASIADNKHDNDHQKAHSERVK